MDWCAADSVVDAGGAAPFDPSGLVVDAEVYPAVLRYPGAPLGRWWEIEDAAVDVGGYPPDTSHFATTLLIDLVASHGDDWFLFPVDARIGRVLTLQSAVVKDAFGKTFELAPPEDDWHLFKTTGLDARSLVVWLRAVTPLQGQPLENVLLGLDEYSNVLWGVERRVNGRDVVAPPRDPAQEALNPTLAPPNRHGSIEPPRRYLYVPGQDAAPFWHPYQIEDRLDDHGVVRRRFIQRRLADLSHVHPELLPAPAAQVLRSRTPDGETVHEIEPATVPSIGIEIERRYMLARDVAGRPVLWLQRQRMPFLAPPSRALRHDVMAEDQKAEG